MSDDRPRTYSLSEAKNDLLRRLGESDEVLIAHSYPVEVLEDGTVVSMELEAERDADWSYEEGEPLRGDPQARPVDHELEPTADFVVRDEGDFGPEWLLDASWVAEETGIGTLPDLLDEAGVDYETVEIEGATHVYLHEEQEASQSKVRERLLRAFHDRYPDYEGPEINSIGDMVS